MNAIQLAKSYLLIVTQYWTARPLRYRKIHDQNKQYAPLTLYSSDGDLIVFRRVRKIYAQSSRNASQEHVSHDTVRHVVPVHAVFLAPDVVPDVSVVVRKTSLRIPEPKQAVRSVMLQQTQHKVSRKRSRDCKLHFTSV